MTRILRMVNLSNWDGEDYEVTCLDFNGKPHTQIIKPGEDCQILDVHAKGGILFRPVESKKLEPFIKEGEGQVTPRMSVEFK